MTTIIIKPKSKKEATFLSRLFKKMNVEASIVEEALPNYETIEAIRDVEAKKGIHSKDAEELFDTLDI